jgi:hypothetical protein
MSDSSSDESGSSSGSGSDAVRKSHMYGRDSDSDSEGVSERESGSDSEPEEHHSSRPSSKQSRGSAEDLPLFMRLQQEAQSGGSAAETRHIQRKLRKQKKGTSE